MPEDQRPQDAPVHLHLLSDSTGETVSAMARSAMAQFSGIKVVEHCWSLVRTKRQLEKAITEIRAFPGFVMHTITDPDFRKTLQKVCNEIGSPCVSLLSRLVSDFSAFLGKEADNLHGNRHVLDREYFSRVEAINYSIAHDDGQITHDLDESDIVIVGVSRTSKSPTSMYLAHWGYRTANVPYVPCVPLPSELLECKHAFIVGLTIRPDILTDIRRNRLLSLEERSSTSYINPETVQEEVREARRLFTRQGWPTVDVTRRSIEETAAAILQLYRERNSPWAKL